MAVHTSWKSSGRTRNPHSTAIATQSRRSTAPAQRPVVISALQVRRCAHGRGNVLDRELTRHPHGRVHDGDAAGHNLRPDPVSGDNGDFVGLHALILKTMEFVLG